MIENPLSRFVLEEGAVTDQLPDSPRARDADSREALRQAALQAQFALENAIERRNLGICCSLRELSVGSLVVGSRDRRRCDK